MRHFSQYSSLDLCINSRTRRYIRAIDFKVRSLISKLTEEILISQDERNDLSHRGKMPAYVAYNRNVCISAQSPFSYLARLARLEQAVTVAF